MGRARLVVSEEVELLTRRSNGTKACDGRLNERLLLLRLVLEGAMQIRPGKEWVAGYDASKWLLGDIKDDSAGAVRSLSGGALTYAASLPSMTVKGLTARLYSYNQQPITARWQRMLAGQDGVLAYLGLSESTPLQRRFEQTWACTTNRADAAWIRWARRGQVSSGAQRESLFKVYVSLPVQNLPAALPMLAESLAASQATFCKFGADAANLMRPDSVVAYFLSIRGMEAFAMDVCTRLHGLPGKGVPFTALERRDGLASLGVDPPHRLCQTRGHSWRTWVAGRLAEHLACAATTGATTPGERVTHALGMLSLNDIDVDRWQPSAFTRPVGALWK